MYRLLIVLGLVTVSSGCASIGAEDYGCSGLPTGVTCMSTRDVFDASNSGNIPVRVARKPDGDSRDSQDKEFKTEKNISQEAEGGRVNNPVLDNYVTPRVPDRPIPIRTPAKVMRIWVATWEDKNSGALMAPGYVYTEVEPRKWVIGKTESVDSQQSQTFNPLGLTNKSRLFKR